MEKRIDTDESKPTACDVLFSLAGGRLLAMAQRRLRSSPYLDLRGIECELIDGTLELCGCVSSYTVKQLAQETVADLFGVVPIGNRLEVRATLSYADNGIVHPNIS